MYLAEKNPEERNSALRKISEQLHTALEFIHGKAYSHNDVSPKNFMMTITSDIDIDLKPFLIDSGIASKFDEDVYGFRGTPQYAHRSVFEKYPRKKWKAVKAYDHSSLAFSIASLLKEGRSPWRSFHPCTLNKRNGTFDTYKIWADERSNAAKKLLKEAAFPKMCWKTYCNDNA